MSQLNSFQVSILNLLVSESIPPLTAYPLAFFLASILVKEFVAGVSLNAHRA